MQAETTAMSEDAKDNVDPKAAASDSAALQLEERKLALEERKFDEDIAFRKLALKVQEKEVDQKIADAKRSRWANPLVLAILAAAATGGTSVWVQSKTAQDQIAADALKHTQEMETEKYKAEATRILEAVKSGDPDKAACTLAFFMNTQLIASPDARAYIGAYLLARKGGAGIGLQDETNTVSVTAAPAPSANKPQNYTIEGCSAGTVNALVVPTPASTSDPAKKKYDWSEAPETKDPWFHPASEWKPVDLNVEEKSKINPDKKEALKTFAYESGWMGGGHNQDEACQAGIQQNQGNYPGKVLKRMTSSETSKKDWLGHVEYRYTCIIGVSDPPSK